MSFSHSLAKPPRAAYKSEYGNLQKVIAADTMTVDEKKKKEKALQPLRECFTNFVLYTSISVLFSPVIIIFSFQKRRSIGLGKTTDT